MDSDDSPALLGVYDTTASLATGNLFYVSKVAKMFPAAVAMVYTSDKFAPVTLSGVVKHDAEGAKTTTELPVALHAIFDPG